MLKKIISSLCCGVYISIGATAFLATDNRVLGAFLFTSGILLVSAFFGGLVTRVVALFPFGEYKIYDIIISLLGNTVGCFVYAFLLNQTRLTAVFLERANGAVQSRLNDNLLSLFILAVFCGFLVASACLSSKVFPDNRMASLFLTVVFIAIFVTIGFEHVVADAFFFSFYIVANGFDFGLIPAFLAIALGNIVGGTATGYLERYRNGEK